MKHPSDFIVMIHKSLSKSRGGREKEEGSEAEMEMVQFPRFESSSLIV